MKKNILFVSHEATRTGAPIVFKHLIQWINANTDFNFSILLRAGGTLEDDFKALGPTYIWAPPKAKKTFFGKLQKKVLFKLSKSVLYTEFPEPLINQKFDLVYLNTVASADLIPYLSELYKCPVILHVHENEFSIRTFFRKSLNSDTLRLTDRYIAVSESTKQNLVENFNVPAVKVSLVNPFVLVKNMPATTMAGPQINKDLKANNEFIVGGSGVTSWRKGTDIFVQLAFLTAKSGTQGRKIKFVWVGEVEYQFQLQLDYELKRMGLTDADIVFTGSVKNPQDYFSAFDVFALTSREDPFPLVCLEAASLGKPIICFDNAGGMPELVCTGGGIVVPYHDARKMADAIINLYNDTGRLNEMGTVAKDKVQQFDVAVQAPKILDIINNQIAGK